MGQKLPVKIVAGRFTTQKFLFALNVLKKDNQSMKEMGLDLRGHRMCTKSLKMYNSRAVASLTSREFPK